MASKVARLLRNLERLGITPINLQYYKQAFSLPGLHDSGYQRLEFLGDSVLGLIIADWCFRSFPDIHEGELTLARAFLVSQDTLVRLAKSLDLHAFLPADTVVSEKQLSDLVESLVGAYYLDHGFAKTKVFILRIFDPLCAALKRNYEANPHFFTELQHDPVSRLQILTQRLTNTIPEYQTLEVSGPPHDRTFHVQARVNLGDTELTNTGVGSSKKHAKKNAAIKLLKDLENLLHLRRQMIHDIISTTDNPVHALTLLSQHFKVTPPRFTTSETPTHQHHVQVDFQLFGKHYASEAVANSITDAKTQACQNIIHLLDKEYNLQPADIKELQKWRRIIARKAPLDFLYWLVKTYAFPDLTFECSELPSGEYHCSLTFYMPQGKLFSQAVASSKSKAKARAAQLLLSKPEFQEFIETYLDEPPTES